VLKKLEYLMYIGTLTRRLPVNRIANLCWP
jgi:hypothetical protein